MSRFVRAGGWLFRRRTSLPLPLAFALLLIPSAESSGATARLAAGAVIVAAGELLRLWAVHHIGVISRTRSERLGPLVSTGPFAFVRNPLYLGNIALWVGFAVSAHLIWLVPIFIVILALEYHAIVRWEEELLGSRRPDEYRAYAARVPRWIPSVVNSRQSAVGSRQSVVGSRDSVVDSRQSPHSWRETFFSERGTLIAIAVGFLLLWIKHHV
jgi:protein-S-isoprenylcysteine O-methyltransferase Ste14